jgi:hypothetical protein
VLVFGISGYVLKELPIFTLKMVTFKFGSIFLPFQLGTCNHIAGLFTIIGEMLSIHTCQLRHGGFLISTIGCTQDGGMVKKCALYESNLDLKIGKTWSIWGRMGLPFTPDIISSCGSVSRPWNMSFILCGPLEQTMNFLLLFIHSSQTWKIRQSCALGTMRRNHDSSQEYS